ELGEKDHITRRRRDSPYAGRRAPWRNRRSAARTRGLAPPKPWAIGETPSGCGRETRRPTPLVPWSKFLPRHRHADEAASRRQGRGHRFEKPHARTGVEELGRVVKQDGVPQLPTVQSEKVRKERPALDVPAGRE